VTATEQLEGAVALLCEGDEQAWAQRLRVALGEVERALGRHPAPTEQKVLAPAGSAHREISPGLARTARALRDRQEAMLHEVDELIARIERGSIARADCADLQDQGNDLVGKLRRFTAAENAMILEAVMGEPGAGD
jgi:hypothetical protein